MIRLSEEQQQRLQEGYTPITRNTTPEQTQEQMPRVRTPFLKGAGNVVKTIFQEAVGKPVTDFVGQGLNAANATAIFLSAPFLKSRGLDQQQITNAARDALTQERKFGFLSPEPRQVVKMYDPNKTAMQNLGEDVASTLGTGLQLGSLIAPGALGRSIPKAALTEAALSGLGEVGYALSGEEDANVPQALAFGGAIGAGFPLLGRAARVLRRTSSTSGVSKVVSKVDDSLAKSSTRFKILQKNIDPEKVRSQNARLRELDTIIPEQRNRVDSLAQDLSTRKAAESERLVETYNTNSRVVAQERIPQRRAQIEVRVDDAFKDLNSTYKRTRTSLAKRAADLPPVSRRVVTNAVEQLPDITRKTDTEVIRAARATLDDAVSALPEDSPKAVRTGMERLQERLRSVEDARLELDGVEEAVRREASGEMARSLKSAEDSMARELSGELDRETSQYQELLRERDEILNDEDYLFAAGVSDEYGTLDEFLDNANIKKELEIDERVVGEIKKMQDAPVVRFYRSPLRIADIMERRSGSTVVKDALNTTMELDTVASEAKAEDIKFMIEAFDEANLNIMRNRMLRPKVTEAKAKRVEAIFDAIDQGKIDDLQGPEKVLAQKVTTWFEATLERINQTRRAVGAEEIAVRKNYVTHMRKVSALDFLGVRYDGDTMKILDISAGDEKTLDAFMPFAIARDEAGIVDIDKNLMRIIMTYSDYAHRDIMSQQAKRLWNPLIDEMRKAKLDNAATYWTRWLNQGVFGKATKIDEAIEGLTTHINLPQAVATLTSVTSRGSLLFNLQTVFNQFTGVAISMAKAPLRDSVNALNIFYDKNAMAYAMKKSQVVRGRAIEVDIGRGQVVGRVEKIGQSMMQEADKYVVVHSWTTQFRRLMRMGMEEAEAIKLADEFAAKTQALYSRAFMAPISRAKVARPFTQFQTWAMNFFETITTDVATEYYKRGGKAAAADITKLMAFMWLSNAAYQAAGLPKPFEERLSSYIPMAGTVDIVTGGEGTVTPFGPPMVYKMLSNVVTLVAGDLEDKKRAAQRVPRDFARLIPGGNQLFKTASGLNSVGKGFVRIGNEKIPVDSPRAALQAILLGPFGVREVQDYFEERE